MHPTDQHLNDLRSLITATDTDLESCAASEDRFLEEVTISVARRGIEIADHMAGDQGTYIRFGGDANAVAFVNLGTGRAFRLHTVHDFHKNRVRFGIAHMEPGVTQPTPFFRITASTLDGRFELVDRAEMSLDRLINASEILRLTRVRTIPLTDLKDIDDALGLKEGLIAVPTLENLRSIRSRAIGPLADELRNRVGPLAERIGKDWIDIGEEGVQAKGQVLQRANDVLFTNPADHDDSFAIRHLHDGPVDVVSIRAQGFELICDRKERGMDDLQSFFEMPKQPLRLSTLLGIVRNLDVVEHALDHVPAPSSQPETTLHP